jgi:3-hydroxyisobutyrate dehydrogenase-like beta-hydroxyacid dehydrogenase
MLANDHAVESVVFARDGITANLPKGSVHISSSTIGVDLSHRLASKHTTAAQCFVSAPVFGRPEAAAAGQLVIVAGGAPHVLETCKPLFDAIGHRTYVMSDRPEAANLVKLSGNFLIASVIEALGEAMALIGKSSC